MQRRRQQRRAKRIHAPVRTDKCRRRLADEERLDSNRPAKVPEIGPAPEVDVLAVVDRFAGGLIDEGARPPAPARARFEERYGEAPLSQRRRRRQPGQPTADDNDPPFHRAPAG